MNFCKDGHRTRFLNQFKILKQFYINSSNLQYFRNLIQVPLLPDCPPNFLLASDINQHVTPVVALVPAQRESPDGMDYVENLVDLSFAEEDEFALVRRESNDDDDFDFHFSTFNANNNSNNNNINNTLVKAIDYKDDFDLIENLKQKITELEMNRIELERKIVQLTMENESSIKEKDELKGELSRANIGTNIGTDVLEEKERALDKFNKLEKFYKDLREEHIMLLRKKAEVDKELIRIRSDYEKLEQDTTNLERNIENENKLKEAFDSLNSKYSSIKEFNSKLLSEISTIKQEKDRALNRLEELELNLSNLKEVQANKIDEFKNKFIIQSLSLLINQIKHHLNQMLEEDELENYNLPNISSSPEYFFKRLSDLAGLVDEFTNQFKRLNRSIQSNESESQLLEITGECTRSCIDFNYNLVYLFFMCKILQQSITNLNTGEELNLNFKLLISTFSTLFNQLIEPRRNEINLSSLDNLSGQLIEQINKIIEMKSEILPHLSLNESKNLQQMLEQEINEMDQAIQEAVSKIEKMLETTKKQDKDIKLEVNGSILESSSCLMKAVMQLVMDSRELQREIVNESGGSANVKEFYQKNHRWTEGLMSASKVVAYACKMLVDSADQVVSGKAEFATIIVSSQEIAASTAQLVAASRVKANSKSGKLNCVLKSSKNVTKLTGEVIGTTRNCINLLNQEQSEARLNQELQKLTIHNAKKVEMECQLNIIRLDDELVKERLKLANLRKIHYHLTE